MSKTLSFRGQLPVGLEDKIRLRTKNGKTGYRITKFQVMCSEPGVPDYESTIKIYSKPQGGGSTGVDFTESDLLAVCYIEDNGNNSNPISEQVIFDNGIVNQDIFVNCANTIGTAPMNYYFELETVALSDIEATQLTLKSLRNLASR